MRSSAPTALLAPVAPSMIWCIGLNYRRHAAESKLPEPQRPVVFAKGPNTVCDPGAPIIIPRTLASTQVDYECELAVVIGKTAKNVSRANALDHVLGYTCANDVSARDWQLQWGGGQWCRGKTFDTFCPLGPCLVGRDEIPDPQALRIATVLNGETVQDWTTGDMIFSVAEINRVPQRQHHAAAGHGDPHRHAARRGHGGQAAALAEGRRPGDHLHLRHRRPHQPGRRRDLTRPRRGAADPCPSPSPP